MPPRPLLTVSSGTSCSEGFFSWTLKYSFLKQQAVRLAESKSIQGGGLTDTRERKPHYNTTLSQRRSRGDSYPSASAGNSISSLYVPLPLLGHGPEQMLRVWTSSHSQIHTQENANMSSKKSIKKKLFSFFQWQVLGQARPNLIHRQHMDAYM